MKTNTFRHVAALLLLSLTTIGLQAQNTAKKAPASFGKTIKGSDFNPCVSTDYEAYLKQKNPNRLSGEQFEQWLAPKVAAAKLARNGQNTNTVVTVPVVVHIIHNGDALGVNENIADEQVLSQIQVLNQDFRNMQDTPGYSDNPAAADIEIEFCMAQRDPQGNLTNGIDRVNLGKASWGSTAVETVLKPQTIWNPEEYLNIWVCNFGGDLYGVGGYAFFPEGANIEGLEGAESNEDNDGLTIWYKVFGSSDIYPEGNYLEGHDKGRSTTHEMGHFLGLRHIWGDGNSCDNTDYCADTPTALAMNMTCSEIDSCPESDGFDMIENHMDYTPDACKHFFTNDQKARMVAVLQNAPRRIALQASTACTAPELGLDDTLKNGTGIYPNPAKDVLYITSNITGVQGSYTIFNALGQAVASKNIQFDAQVAINVEGLNKGIYFIKISREGKTSTLKFIKD